MAMIARVFAALLLFVLGSAHATTVGSLAKPIKGTVDIVQIPKTGGGVWQSVNIIKPTGVIGTAVIVAHGGGGDDITNCMQYAVCANVNQSYIVTNATWTPTNGGQATYTVSTDPTMFVVPGRPITISGIAPSGYNGQFVAIAATATPTKTVTVAMQRLGSPGHFVASGTLSSPMLSADTIYWQTPQNFNTLFVFVQGPPPLGGTDDGNTPNFTASISGTVMTVTAISSGVLSKNQVVTGAGIATGTTITGYGTGNGYSTGTYNVSISQTVASEAMTANNCPYAPQSSTWPNWAMTNCQNGLLFFSDLVSYIHSAYGVPLSRFGILGHSNGGMEVERLLIENPSLFSWYGMLAGPQSVYYNYHTIVPSTYAVNAMWMFGDQDDVLCEAGYSSGCTNTPISFTGSISGTTLHVSSIASGILRAGQNIVSASSHLTDGTYITAQTTTAGGDLATFLVSQSQTAASQAMYASNTFDATTSQNTAQASAADLVYPLPMTWNAITSTAAYWAKNQCSPAGVTSQILPTDAVVTSANIGVERTWSYCGGKIVVYELSNAGHEIHSLHLAAGRNPLVQFLLFIKSN